MQQYASHQGSEQEEKIHGEVELSTADNPNQLKENVLELNCLCQERIQRKPEESEKKTAKIP